jgi:hypothetical protein
MMNAGGKSDRSKVPGKPSNKAERTAAETVEGRGRTKGNLPERNALRTQGREGAPSALERVRQVAKGIAKRVRARNARRARSHLPTADGIERNPVLPSLATVTMLHVPGTDPIGCVGVPRDGVGRRLERYIMKLHNRNRKVDFAWFLSSIFLALAQRSIAQGLNEPSWPQNFQVLQGEPTSFGFVASQPGPISVRVQSGGVPVIVTLSGPLAQPVERPPGTGVLSLDYNVTANDTARGSIWLVQIRAYGTPMSSASKMQPTVTIVDASTPRLPAAQLLKPVAWGTIAVRHPPGDLNRARAELAARRRPPLQVAQANTLAQQVLQQRQAQYQQAVAAAQAAQTQQLANQYSGLAKVIASPPQGAAKVLAPATQGAARAIASPTQGAAKVIASTATQLASVPKVAGPTTPVQGQIGPQSIKPAPTPWPPVISSLSVNHGQPRAPVVVHGSGLCPYVPGSWFGCGAEVHFVMSAANDLVICTGPHDDPFLDSDGKNAAWFCHVPDASGVGVLGVDAQIYVKALATDGAGNTFIDGAGNVTWMNSTPVPFHFDPGLAFAQLIPTCTGPDTQVNANDLDCSVPSRIAHFGWNDIWGHKAEDRFYLTTALKNGWIVDSVAVVLQPCDDVIYSCNGVGAYVVDSRVGTNSPYVDVHWWMDAFKGLGYQVVVNVKGPVGVPYQ